MRVKKRLIFAGVGTAVGVLGLLLVSHYFPDTTAAFVADKLLSWLQTGVGLLIGGLIGAFLAACRDILDQVGHLKKMFLSYVLVNRKRLKDDNFFDDSNGQKYCCEGVVGSDEEFRKLLDECFIAVCLVVFCILWGFGCMMLAVRAVKSEVSWTFTLISLSAFINLGRVLHPIVKFQFRQDLRHDNPRLAWLAQEMTRLADPEHRLPAIVRHRPVHHHRGRRGQQGQANQPAPPVEIPEETPEEHAQRKRLLLEAYQREKTQILTGYPYVYETEPATTKNMWFIGVALSIWLSFWAWIGLMILQRGFGVWLEAQSSSSTQTANNSTNSTNNSSWPTNGSVWWLGVPNATNETQWVSNDYRGWMFGVSPV